MEFDKIKSEIKAVGLDNVRADNEDYFEAVVSKDAAGKLMKALEGSLGKAVWPSNDKIPPGAGKIVKDLGGLRTGQTLFFANDHASSVFAMLWPWQDGERMTLKMGKTRV